MRTVVLDAVLADDLDDERRRVGLVFLVLAALAPLLSLLPPDGTTTPLAAVVYLATVGAVAAVSWRRWDRLAALAGPSSVAFVLAVALLRHAEGGATSGLAPLLMLPLLWCALVGTRRSVAMVLVAMALVLIVPILVLGAPDYPVTEWRRAAVWIAVAPVVGGATLRLRRRSEQARDAVVVLARTDALTGCLNRRGLAEVVDREVARARRAREPITVAMLDLDHFKRFNDAHGHDVGDDLLREAVAAWHEGLRATDALARWGGEEFVVLLPGTDVVDAVPVLDRMRQRTPRGVTASLGVARLQVGDDDGFRAAITAADTALYRAKAEGRDRVVTAEPAAGP